MPDTLPRVIGLVSAVVDQHTKDVVVTLNTEGETKYEIRLHPGVIGGLVVALIKLAAAVSPVAADREFTGQVMVLTGVRPARGPQGEPILDLMLEGSLHFPVTFPPDAIPALQTVLAKLAASSTSGPAAPRRH